MNNKPKHASQQDLRHNDSIMDGSSQPPSVLE